MIAHQLEKLIHNIDLLHAVCFKTRAENFAEKQVRGPGKLQFNRNKLLSVKL